MDQVIYWSPVYNKFSKTGLPYKSEELANISNESKNYIKNIQLLLQQTKVETIHIQNITKINYKNIYNTIKNNMPNAILKQINNEIIIHEKYKPILLVLCYLRKNHNDIYKFFTNYNLNLYLNSYAKSDKVIIYPLVYKTHNAKKKPYKNIDFADISNKSKETIKNLLINNKETLILKNINKNITSTINNIFNQYNFTIRHNTTDNQIIIYEKYKPTLIILCFLRKFYYDVYKSFSNYNLNIYNENKKIDDQFYNSNSDYYSSSESDTSNDDGINHYYYSSDEY